MVMWQGFLRLEMEMLRGKFLLMIGTYLVLLGCVVVIPVNR